MTHMTISFALFDTPIGSCAIAWSSRGVAGVQLPEMSVRMTRNRMLQRFPGVREAKPPPEMAQIRDALALHLRGTPSDLASIQLDMDLLPPFHRHVYEAARAIPWGATATYGALAMAMGTGGAARAVGQALARNPFPIIVPCHRVVAAGGRIGGFSANGSVSLKRRLLAIEGQAGRQVSQEPCRANGLAKTPSDFPGRPRDFARFHRDGSSL